MRNWDVLGLNFSFTKTCSTSGPSLFLGHGSPELVIVSLRVIISSALKDYRRSSSLFRSSSTTHQLLCPTKSISGKYLKEKLEAFWGKVLPRGSLSFEHFRTMRRRFHYCLLGAHLCSIASCAVPQFSKYVMGKINHVFESPPSYLSHHPFKTVKNFADIFSFPPF